MANYRDGERNVVHVSNRYARKRRHQQRYGDSDSDTWRYRVANGTLVAVMIISIVAVAVTAIDYDRGLWAWAWLYVYHLWLRRIVNHRGGTGIINRGRWFVVTFDPHRAIGALGPVTFFPGGRWRVVDRGGRRLRRLPIAWAPRILSAALQPTSFNPYRTTARAWETTLGSADATDGGTESETGDEG